MLQTVSIVGVSCLIGVCFTSLIGCNNQVPPNPTASNPQPLPSPTPSEPVPSGKADEAKMQSIISSIKQIEQQSDLLSQKMLGRQQKISSLELQKNQLETDLGKFNREFKLFIESHKEAAFCREVAGVSSDKNNQYEEDVKNIAGGLTLVCGAAYVSNEKFRNDVNLFVDNYRKADNYANDLKNQIQAIQLQINTENESSEQEKAELGRLASEIQKYQSLLGITQNSATTIPTATNGNNQSQSQANRPLLGVKIASLTPEVRQKINNDKNSNLSIYVNKGVLIVEVEKDSPAADAGMQVGDVIVMMNGKTVTDSGEIIDEVKKTQVGSDLPLEIYRGSQKLRILVYFR